MHQRDRRLPARAPERPVIRALEHPQLRADGPRERVGGRWRQEGIARARDDERRHPPRRRGAHSAPQDLAHGGRALGPQARSQPGRHVRPRRRGPPGRRRHRAPDQEREQGPWGQDEPAGRTAAGCERREQHDGRRRPMGRGGERDESPGVVPDQDGRRRQGGRVRAHRRGPRAETARHAAHVEQVALPAAVAEKARKPAPDAASRPQPGDAHERGCIAPALRWQRLCGQHSRGATKKALRNCRRAFLRARGRPVLA